MPLSVGTSSCPPLRLLAALLGSGGHQDCHGQHQLVWGGGRRRAPPPPGLPSRPAPVARPTPQRPGLLRGGPDRARCGWCRPLAAPRQRSRRYNPRQRPSRPCSLRRRRCSRSASTRVSPGTQSGNGASPKSCRDGTRLNGSSPPRMGALRCVALVGCMA